MSKPDTTENQDLRLQAYRSVVTFLGECESQADPGLPIPADRVRATYQQAMNASKQCPWKTLGDRYAELAYCIEELGYQSAYREVQRMELARRLKKAGAKLAMVARAEQRHGHPGFQVPEGESDGNR